MTRHGTRISPFVRSRALRGASALKRAGARGRRAIPCAFTCPSGRVCIEATSPLGCAVCAPTVHVPFGARLHGPGTKAPCRGVAHRREAAVSALRPRARPRSRHRARRSARRRGVRRPRRWLPHARSTPAWWPTARDRVPARPDEGGLGASFVVADLVDVAPRRRRRRWRLDQPTVHGERRGRRECQHLRASGAKARHRSEPRSRRSAMRCRRSTSMPKRTPLNARRAPPRRGASAPARSPRERAASPREGSRRLRPSTPPFHGACGAESSGLRGAARVAGWRRGAAADRRIWGPIFVKMGAHIRDPGARSESIAAAQRH